MLAQIPRKPTFPEHVIKKEIAMVEDDVQNQVIPVSTGIYSQYKLNQKLQAIPKPILADYEDPIFYELADTARFPQKTVTCPLCSEQYGNKLRKPVQCKFCGIWNCSQCICPRKRYHPRAKDNNSERYDICYNCDDKFLNLTLNHSFMERKCLLEEIIQRVKREKEEATEYVEKMAEISAADKDKSQKNEFRIAALKKEKRLSLKVIETLKNEREQQLLKKETKRQYLQQLIKKQKQKQEQLRLMRRNSSKEQREHVEIRKAVKNLSQNIAYSEAIHQERPQEDIQDVKQPYQTEKESPVAPQLEPQRQSEPERKVQNFFNYHEWGKREAEVKPLTQNQLENSEDDKSGEDQTGFDSNKLSPNYLITDPEQSEHVYKSEAQKKIAEIFEKPEPPRYNYEDDLDEQPEIDPKQVELMKKELLRAQFQRSLSQRMVNSEMPTSAPQKCTCQIY